MGEGRWDVGGHRKVENHCYRVRLLFVRKPPLAEQFVTGQVELFQLFDVLEPGPAAVPAVLIGFQSTCVRILEIRLGYNRHFNRVLRRRVTVSMFA